MGASHLPRGLLWLLPNPQAVRTTVPRIRIIFPHLAHNLCGLLHHAPCRSLHHASCIIFPHLTHNLCGLLHRTSCRSLHHVPCISSPHLAHNLCGSLHHASRTATPVLCQCFGGVAQRHVALCGRRSVRKWRRTRQAANLGGEGDVCGSFKSVCVCLFQERTCLFQERV